ncbi:MAG TPA: tRNA uridine-5-carboxymethylaminomethyl(34) synthesis enzyme MnmG, partial [Candidatus Hungatella pullicola]|nr:tRNA uridine-5-carboxymethylaminomethyl(34) synthesis enzyme MnmG [Candidatus Hungatella pullicola]
EYDRLLWKEKAIEEESRRLETVNIGTSEKVQNFLAQHNSTVLKSGTTLAELVKRPELNYFMLTELDDKRPKLPYDVQEQVNINIKYEGYIKRQMQQVAQFKKLENKKIPEDFDYSLVNSLRKEAVQKLNQRKPANIGQASRISGVSPADISVLLVYMEQMRHGKG